MEGLLQSQRITHLRDSQNYGTDLDGSSMECDKKDEIAILANPESDLLIQKQESLSKTTSPS